MSEREEKLINKISQLQKAHNSLKLEDEIKNYEIEIKKVEKDIEKTKKEIQKLSSELNELENNNNDDNHSSNNQKNIENKKILLNNLINGNNIMSQQLNMLKANSENFNNQNYILNIVNYWNPQTMFKFIRLYDKKHE